MALATLVKLQGIGRRARSNRCCDADERAWLAELKATDLDALPYEYPRRPSRLGDRAPAPHAIGRGDPRARPRPAAGRPARPAREHAQGAARGGAASASNSTDIRARPTPISPARRAAEAKSPSLNQHPMFLDGAVEVQDEGSQILGMLVEPRRGEMVVDFCAGAGGKTLQMGAAMDSQRPPLRLRRLRQAPGEPHAAPEALGPLERASRSASPTRTTRR